MGYDKDVTLVDKTTTNRLLGSMTDVCRHVGSDADFLAATYRVISRLSTELGQLRANGGIHAGWLPVT